MSRYSEISSARTIDESTIEEEYTTSHDHICKILQSLRK